MVARLEQRLHSLVAGIQQKENDMGWRALGLGLPVVVILPFGDEQAQRSARRNGARDLICTPFPLASLLDCVRNNI